jgi:hypothetical protein
MMGLSYYGKFHHPWLDLKTCRENPAQYHGQLVTSFDEPQIGPINSDGFQLIQKQSPPIRVLADTTGLVSGEFVGLTAIFHQEGYLKVISLHVARKRRSKIWLSVIPALFVGVLILRHYRFNWKKREIQLKEYA